MLPRAMYHSTTGLVHLVASLLALASGAVVFFRPKAGVVHRRLGYLYAASMLTVNLTALVIYRLTGRFNVLHAFALLSLTGVILGLRHAVTRRPRETWLLSHYSWMTWSYAGLLAALVAESGTRVVLPLLRNHGIAVSMGGFWTVVGVLSAGVMLAARTLIHRHRPASQV
jgi:uncharacterized membrane protein